MVRYDWSDLGPAHRAVLDLVPPRSRVLEMGANTGYMTRALRDLGCHVTAVEYDAAAYERVREVADVAHHLDLDCEALAELGGGYDVVVYADVLEHLLDPAAALRRTAPLLAAGGSVVVSIPHVAFWRVRWDLLRGHFDYTDYGILDRTHLHFYTERTLRQLVADGGFEMQYLGRVHEQLPFGERRLPAPVRAMRSAIARWLVRRESPLTTYQFIGVLVPSGDDVSGAGAPG